MPYVARQPLFLCAILLLALGAAGCDLAGDTGPEEARLVLEGTAGSAVRVITSTHFQRVQEPGSGVGVYLLDADTAQVTLPFEQTYAIADAEQFFAKVIRLDPAADNLFMRGYIDGDVRYSNRATVGQDTLQFTYVSRSPY